MSALANLIPGSRSCVVAACLLALYPVTLACPVSAQESSGYSDEQKGWALGTCAVLTQVNKRSHSMLGGRPPSAKSAVANKATLASWWDVNSREDLLKALSWIEEGGHRKQFDAMSKLSQPQLDAIASRKEDDPEAANQAAVVREYADVVDASSLLGWDYSRYVSLCGWGFLAGYLNEDEAWSHIMPKAEKLQQTFGSWHDLGENYLIGRKFWSLANTEKTGGQYTVAVNWLETAPESPWKKYPWNLNLDAKLPGRANPTVPPGQ